MSPFTPVSQKRIAGIALALATFATAGYAAPTGSNVALNKLTTVSSFYNNATKGDKAVDSNTASYWRTKSRSTLFTESISVDLGNSINISRVVLNWNTYYATQYAIEISQDNFNWSTVYSVSSENGGTDVINFSAVNTRYVRMTSRAWNNNSQRIRLNELEIYADDGIAPPPPVSGTWSVVPSPNGTDANNTLRAVTAINANEVWAVGVTSSLNSSNRNTLIERWNGAAWNVIPAPNPSTTGNELNGIAATSTSDIWAVGVLNSTTVTNNRSLVLHWDGASWLHVPGPDVPNAASQLYAVSTLSSTDAWAVGSYSGASTNYFEQPLAGRWNGGFWSPVPTPTVGTQSRLQGIAAVSTNNVWAVGSADNQALIMNWDGNTWRVVNLPTLANSSLNAITVVAPNDIWAVGYSGTGPLTLRYNGSTWSVVASPSPNDTRFSDTTRLYGISANASNDIWAAGTRLRSSPGAGDFTRYTYFTEILHWNGSTWRIVASPDPSANTSQLFGIARVTANDMWAVGNVDFTNTLIERYTTP